MNTAHAPVLQLEEFGVSIGDRVVLSSVTLAVPPRGIMALLGPGGEGKSTLVRTIAGFNDCRPAMKTWGVARFEGRRIEEGRRPTLIIQKFRLLMSSVREYMISALPDRCLMTLLEQRERLFELFQALRLESLFEHLEISVIDFPLAVQRQFALARAYALDVPLICADEPDAGLDDPEAIPLLGLMKRIAEERAVLWVTHNQKYARDVSACAALLAGGRIWESAETGRFFSNPRTDVGRTFVNTGRCAVPSPMACPEEIDSAVPPPPPLPLAARAKNHRQGPTDFYWLQPGAIGGLPRPGIVANLDTDLAGLRRLGVTLLVTLEEARTVDAAVLAAFGMKSRLFPIKDMDVPSVKSAIEFCQAIDADMRAGEIVALHCRAGMGRTGTMLACHLIFQGATPLDALERTREINPRWIQSRIQVQFLTKFSDALTTTRQPHTKEK